MMDEELEPEKEHLTDSRVETTSGLINQQQMGSAKQSTCH